MTAEAMAGTSTGKGTGQLADSARVTLRAPGQPEAHSRTPQGKGRGTALALNASWGGIEGEGLYGGSALISSRDIPSPPPSYFVGTLLSRRWGIRW